mmetsp:Transcript_57384/g.123219  ORF Transcript_57384/g.123219 Transcript_57384/m.123219 type:complete len:133 (+) Transcript_57384:256-654(+)
MGVALKKWTALFGLGHRTGLAGTRCNACRVLKSDASANVKLCRKVTRQLVSSTGDPGSPWTALSRLSPVVSPHRTFFGRVSFPGGSFGGFSSISTAASWVWRSAVQSMSARPLDLLETHEIAVRSFLQPAGV